MGCRMSTVACRDCGYVRLAVTLKTFVCRRCLSLFGVRVPKLRHTGGEMSEAFTLIKKERKKRGG